MRYVLDTNVILFYLKDDATKELIETTFHPFSKDNTAIISIVSIAEIGVIARRNNWGERRIKIVEKIYDKLVVVDINSNDLIEAYIDIESYGENKHPSKRYSDSSRNMGKNDLWIAATTLVTGSELITSDKDFQHLNGEFFKVHLIQRQ